MSHSHRASQHLNFQIIAIISPKDIKNKKFRKVKVPTGTNQLLKLGFVSGRLVLLGKLAGSRARIVVDCVTMLV